MNWCFGECTDNLFQPLQNQWSDVEVRWFKSTTNAPGAHVDIFYVNIAALWRLCAGALSSAPGIGGLAWSSTPAYSCHPHVEVRWVDISTIPKGTFP
jgi:hypothetical protein